MRVVWRVCVVRRALQLKWCQQAGDWAASTLSAWDLLEGMGTVARTRGLEVSSFGDSAHVCFISGLWFWGFCSLVPHFLPPFILLWEPSPFVKKVSDCLRGFDKVVSTKWDCKGWEHTRWFPNCSSCFWFLPT